MQVDNQSLDDCPLIPLKDYCPACGKLTACRSEDHFFQIHRYLCPEERTLAHMIDTGKVT